MARNRFFGKIAFSSRMDEFVKDFKDEASRRAYRCGNEVRTEALKGMRGPKHGLRYKVPGTKRRDYSAPGEFPAVRTGALRTSVRVIVEVEAFPSTGAVARALIGSHLLYGLFLEEGTPRMAARPWITMAIRNALPAIQRILGERWPIG